MSKQKTINVKKLGTLKFVRRVGWKMIEQHNKAVLMIPKVRKVLIWLGIGFVCLVALFLIVPIIVLIVSLL